MSQDGRELRCLFHFKYFFITAYKARFLQHVWIIRSDTEI